MLNNNRFTMTVADVRAHLLHYLYRKNKPIMAGDLKGKTIGMPGSYDEIMSELFSNGYIGLQENFVSLSPEGQQYMQQEEKLEKDRIQRLVFEDEFELALLEFLSYRGTLVRMDDIPKLLKDHAQGKGYGDGPIHDVLFQLEQKGYISNPYPQWYGITGSGKDFYQYQIGKFNRLHGNAESKGGGSNDSSGINVGSIGTMTINHISGGNNQVNSTSPSMHIASEEDPVTKELARQQLDDMPKMKWYRK